MHYSFTIYKNSDNVVAITYTEGGKITSTTIYIRINCHEFWTSFSFLSKAHVYSLKMQINCSKAYPYIHKYTRKNTYIYMLVFGFFYTNAIPVVVRSIGESIFHH